MAKIAQAKAALTEVEELREENARLKAEIRRLKATGKGDRN